MLCFFTQRSCEGETEAVPKRYCLKNRQRREEVSQTPVPWVSLAVSALSCVTLGKIQGRSGPAFFHPQNGPPKPQVTCMLQWAHPGLGRSLEQSSPQQGGSFDG